MRVPSQEQWCELGLAVFADVVRTYNAGIRLLLHAEQTDEVKLRWADHHIGVKEEEVGVGGEQRRRQRARPEQRLEPGDECRCNVRMSAGGHSGDLHLLGLASCCTEEI